MSKGNTRVLSVRKAGAWEGQVPFHIALLFRGICGLPYFPQLLIETPR